jgi:L-2,4-diaminobutyric acid acetyltransferase
MRSGQSLIIGNAREDDARTIWEKVTGCAELDGNSYYCYFLLCSRFNQTTYVATIDGELVGFSTGFLTPNSPSTLFIWQMFVDPKWRGEQVAANLIRHTVTNQEITPRYIEATIDPANEASRRTFASVASTYNCRWDERPYLQAADFASLSEIHPPENLIRVGPLDTSETPQLHTLQ